MQRNLIIGVSLTGQLDTCVIFALNAGYSISEKRRTPRMLTIVQKKSNSLYSKGSVIWRRIAVLSQLDFSHW